MSSSSCSWRASCFEVEEEDADETEGEEKIRQKMAVAMAIFSLSLSYLLSTKTLINSFFVSTHFLWLSLGET